MRNPLWSRPTRGRLAARRVRQGLRAFSLAVPDQAVPTGNISSRVIVHVDLDCFYAQVEMISNPELKNKPLGVQQKSLVITCNYEARKLGVKKCMKVRDAKEKCPKLVLVNGEDLTRYREMSYKVTELLGEFTPLVERLGFDENFVDLTQIVEKRLQQLQSDDLSAVTMSGHVYNNQSVDLHDTMHVRLLIGSQIAAEMRNTMYNQLGLTGCAGIASNKLLAKLVSGVFKPNQQTVLLPESCQDLILGLNHVKEIPGIGYKTAKCLEALGIHTVHELQTFSSKILEEELGISLAQHIKKLSFGEDNSSVIPSGQPQSFSEEESFKKCSSEVEAKKKIEELLALLLHRLFPINFAKSSILYTVYRNTQHWARDLVQWFHRQSCKHKGPSLVPSTPPPKKPNQNKKLSILTWILQINWRLLVMLFIIGHLSSML